MDNSYYTAYNMNKNIALIYDIVLHINNVFYVSF